MSGNSLANYCECKISYVRKQTFILLKEKLKIMDTKAPVAMPTDHNALLDSPRGPTLSTSTSSFEALDPHDPNLSRLAVKMFSKTEEFVTSEMSVPLEDYKLLEQMNIATIAKYSDMRQIAENLSVSTNEVSLKFVQLAPFMKQIEEISDTVDKLEAAAYKLDAYSIALENRIKSVLQRKPNLQ